MEVFTETKRLILRKLVLSDLDGMFELDSNPEVHKYLGNNPVKDQLQSIQSIEDKITQYKDYGIGRWAVIDRNNGDFMGWAGLKFVTDSTNKVENYYDLGYRLIQRYWGKGIASEAASAIIEKAFTILNIKEIYAMADCDNIASDKTLKSIGMKLVEEFEQDGTKYNWYKIEQADIGFDSIKV